MGNSRAYPVLRTTDAATAYAQAKILCGLLEHREDKVGLFAELRTPEEVRRMAAVLPGATLDHVDVRTDPATGAYLTFDLDVTTADDAALEAHLPLELTEDVPRGSVEDHFVAALGQGMAALDWHGRWPEDPETGSSGAAKYDGVQLVFHCDDTGLERWTAQHTVLVHADKWGDLPRATRLAAHIGSDVLGDAQLGW
jgi:hypothetical protein